VFFLKAKVPARFSRNEKVELAAVDGSFDTELSLADGSLMLEDAKPQWVAWNRCNASFLGLRAGSLARHFGDGATGDWLPLGTLVRLPGFKSCACPPCAGQAMHVERNQSILADSFALRRISTTRPTFADFTGPS